MQVLLPANVRRALFGWFDAILFVLQVPLTDDGARQGGLLVFACDDGRLVHAKRSMGNILAHDGDAVHGVTALVKGVRLIARFSTFVSFPSLPIIFPQSSSRHFRIYILTPARMYGLFVLRARNRLDSSVDVDGGAAAYV